MIARAVFDCMVFLQGAGRPNSPARASLRLVDADKVALYLSPEILAEVRDVLTRPKIQQRFPVLTQDWVEAFVSNIESKGNVVVDVPKVFVLARDPKDEPYINLAIAAGARFLVSRDKDLLDLMSDNGFRARYPDLTILDPAAFLQSITNAEQAGPSEPPGT